MRPHPASARALSAALAVPWSWHGRPWTGSLCVWTYCIDALMRGRVVELHAVKRVRYVACRGRAARGHAHAKSRGQAAHVVAGRCTVASGNRRVETITRGRVTRLRRVVCLERGERRGRATLSTWYVRPEANGKQLKANGRGSRQDLPRDGDRAYGYLDPPATRPSQRESRHETHKELQKSPDSFCWFRLCGPWARWAIRHKSSARAQSVRDAGRPTCHFCDLHATKYGKNVV